MRYETIDELRAAWDCGELSRLDFVAHARALITEDNLDKIIEAIPSEVYPLFLRVVQGIVADGATIALGRGEPLGEAENLRDILRAQSTLHSKESQRIRGAKELARSRMPRPPEELVGALQDRIHPTSGRLISAKPIEIASKKRKKQDE